MNGRVHPGPNVSRVASRARRMVWVPSLLVGIAAAIGVATGAAVLLYDSRGLPGAVAGLAGITVLSLAAGLRMGVGDRADDTLPAVTSWWVGLLVALLAGAGFAALWETMDGFGTAPVAQGLGLAFTGALPAYFAGGVWGRIGSFAGSLGAGVRGQVMIGAVVGVVAGAALVLGFLGRPVLAVTAFLAATVFASGGARCQGWIFDRVPLRRVLLRGSGCPGIRFERWETSVPSTETRVLWEVGRGRAVVPPPRGDWRRAVAATLDPAGGVLFVGVGGWFARDGEGEWRVHEPDAGVGAMAAEGFGWPAESLAESPVPQAPGCTVVVDWDGSGDTLVNSFTIPELLQEFRTAGVRRVWIRCRPGRWQGQLAEAADEAGFGVVRYAATAAGLTGPPRVTPASTDVWCLDRSGDLPGPLSGMTLLGAGERTAESAGS